MEHNQAQVLMLTAKLDLEDKIHGLEIGADDYMTKPFEIRELIARVKALTRRNRSSENIESLSVGDLRLDAREHKLFCEKSGQHVKLAEKEYLLMEYMMLNRNQILSKEQISNRIWVYDKNVEYNSAEVYISFLRKKLDYLDSPVRIRTVRGVGYRMEDKV